jgi:hypothetical protein
VGLEEFKSKYESVARIDRKEKNTSLVEMNRAVKNVNAYNEEKQLASEYLLSLQAGLTLSGTVLYSHEDG